MADTPEGLTRGDVSGVAYTFALALFDFFQSQGRQIPIAVLNTATGSTGISSWLPPVRGRHLQPGQGQNGFDRPAVEFQNKVMPLTRMAVRGVLWYQGENNVGSEAAARHYEADLRRLIPAWRSVFRAPESPFLVVELAAYAEKQNHPYDEAPLRQAQIAAAASVSNAVAVPIYDFSLQWNVGPFAYKAPIHPLDKAPVGQRLAEVAEHLTYGESPHRIVSTLRSCHLEGGSLIVKFSNVGGGLHTSDGQALRGFRLARQDGVFQEIAAVLHGATVVIPLVAPEDVIDLTYAYQNDNHTANLVNGYAIPVNPFRAVVRRRCISHFTSP